MLDERLEIFGNHNRLILNEYAYLGIPVDRNNSPKTITKVRRSKVKSAMGSAASFLESKNIAAYSIQLLAFRSIILPVAAFRGELLGMYKRNVAVILHAVSLEYKVHLD